MTLTDSGSMGLSRVGIDHFVGATKLGFDASRNKFIIVHPQDKKDVILKNVNFKTMFLLAKIIELTKINPDKLFIYYDLKSHFTNNVKLFHMDCTGKNKDENVEFNTLKTLKERISQIEEFRTEIKNINQIRSVFKHLISTPRNTSTFE